MVVEVDSSLVQRNVLAEYAFIRDFGRQLYTALDIGTEPLRDVHHVYFTRIFCPDRDKKGSYVRLHFFLRQAEAQATAEAELDRQLSLYQRGGGTVVSVADRPAL